jgi:Mg/Co/Ni transporter MgtE
MAKFQKKDQNNTMNAKNTNNFSQEKKQISASVEQKIKDALVELNKKDKKEVEEMFGKGEFTEQLRKYFEENNPALLDELENKEHLKIYVEQLKNNGFTLQNLVENAKNLDESFKESDSEYDVSIKSITKLKDYCEKEKGRLPS